MDKLVITTPARLHLGLIDMNGEIGRIDGGVGLAIADPHTKIEATRADKITAECKPEPAMVERIVTALEAVKQKYDLGGIHLDVLERPLPHVGMGSATQALVGAAKAYCSLYGVERDIAELAACVGRGGTSGIGVESLRTGGFIVDGGHPFGRGENCKTEYSPSSASEGILPPPVLARYDFPDWDVLVVVPLGEGASGLREVTIFKVVCPLPLSEVQHMCHIMMMQLMPAVLENDLEMFCRGVEDFQTHGFKVFEFRAQTRLLHRCLDFLKENGARGAGMSSWGPTLFAFGDNLEELQEKSKGWLAENGGGETILTKANNVGMEILDQV